MTCKAPRPHVATGAQARTEKHDDLEEDVVVHHAGLGELREKVEEVVALRERLKVELRHAEVGERA